MAEQISDGRGLGNKAGVTSDGGIYIADFSNRYIQRIAYNAQGLAEYIGFAAPGTAEDTALWQIRKLTYANMRVTAVNFASGDANFDKKWSLKTEYTYT